MLGKVLKENHKNWYSFVREKSSPSLKPHEMVFVTGCDLASDWMAATISASKSKVKLCFKVTDPSSISNRVSLWGSWSSSDSLTTPMRFGPSPGQKLEHIKDAPHKNQCIFFRGWRFDGRNLRAAAGPHDLGYGEDKPDGGSSGIVANVEFDMEGDCASSVRVCIPQHLNYSDILRIPDLEKRRCLR